MHYRSSRSIVAPFLGLSVPGLQPNSIRRWARSAPCTRRRSRRFRSAPQENARPADRLNASIVALAQSLITPDADDSLAQSQIAPDADFKVARQENEVLRKKIAELEKSKQSLSSMLGNMGIRV